MTAAVQMYRLWMSQPEGHPSQIMQIAETCPSCSCYTVLSALCHTASMHCLDHTKNVCSMILSLG